VRSTLSTIAPPCSFASRLTDWSSWKQSISTVRKWPTGAAHGLTNFQPIALHGATASARVPRASIQNSGRSSTDGPLRLAAFFGVFQEDSQLRERTSTTRASWQGRPEAPTLRREPPMLQSSTQPRSGARTRLWFQGLIADEEETGIGALPLAAPAGPSHALGTQSARRDGGRSGACGKSAGLSRAKPCAWQAWMHSRRLCISAGWWRGPHSFRQTAGSGIPGLCNVTPVHSPQAARSTALVTNNHRIDITITILKAYLKIRSPSGPSRPFGSICS
jgi:hypothetical protein